MEKGKREFEQKVCQMLRPLRTAAGLSLSELADKLGMSRTGYIMYEAGKVCPDLFTVKKLADAFGVDVSIFFNPDQYTASADCS